MIGSIYCLKRCTCGSTFKYDENRAGLFCRKCGEKATGPFRVIFTEGINRNFGHDFRAAETFLLHLRHQKTTESFDVRDYKRDAPLGFKAQSDRWLQHKKETVSPKVLKNMELVIGRAARAWGNRNVKSIKSGDIEDFLFGQRVGNKTRHNYKSYLHDFWTWLERRESIPVPRFPEIPFKLGYRKIIDIQTQQAIIDEVKNIIYDRNPKVWLAIRMLCRYFHIRPGELMRITEGNVNVQIPVMVLPPKSSKIGEPVMIFLWDDDVDEIRKLPQGLPSLRFFRHPANGRAEAGKPFGSRLLYKIWTQACKNLGLMRSETKPIVDLYAGTRHSTMTALAEHMSPEEIQQASGHRTTAAMTRYLQGRSRYAQKAGNVIAQMQSKGRGDAQIIQFGGSIEKG